MGDLGELLGKSVRCGLLQAVEVFLHGGGGWGVVFGEVKAMRSRRLGRFDATM